MVIGRSEEDVMKLAPFSHRPEVLIDTEQNSRMNRVNRWDATGARTVTINPDRERRRGRDHARTDDTPDEAGAHLESLRNMAAQVNEDLASRNSPHRFYVFEEGGEVFINLVLLDAAGSVVRIIRKDITHAEFSDLVRQLERGEGLFLELVG